MILPTGYGLQYVSFFGAIDFVAPGLGAGKNYGSFFYGRDYTGAVTELDPGEEPCVIDTAQDALIGRKNRKATFQVFASPSVEMRNFYAEDEQQFLAVVAEVNSQNQPTNVHYVGYISPFDASDDINPAPRPIEFSATDGLGSLSDFSYRQYPAGLPFSGTDTLQNIIRNCLKWLSYDLDLWFSMHLVEEANWLPNTAFGIAQWPGPTVDAFGINRVNINRWLTDEGDFKSCAEVLDDLCATFRMRIIQHAGVWKFLDVDELPGLLDANGTTRSYYWNTYAVPVGNAAPVKGQVIENPLVTISEDVGCFVPFRGAKTAIQASKKRYKVTLDYGGLNSELTNGGILGAPGTVPQGWERISSVAGSCVIDGDGSPEHPAGIIIRGMKNGDPRKSYQTDQRYLNVIQQYILIPIKAGQKRTISVSGTYINYRTGGAAMEVIAELGFIDTAGQFGQAGAFIVSHGGGGQLLRFALQSSGAWSSKYDSNTVNYLHFLNLLPDGTGNGKTYYQTKPTQGEPFSITSQELPSPINGANIADYVVRLYLVLWPGPDYDTPKSHEGAYTIYRNINLTTGDNTVIDLSGEVIITQTARLNFKLRKKSEEIPLKLGDQTTAVAIPAKPVRPGALLRADGSPTTRWIMAYGGHVDRIQNQVARNALVYTAVQRDIYDGKCAGDLSPLSIYVAEDLKNKKLVCLTHKWSLKNRTVNLRAVEIPSDLDRLLEVDVDGNFQTADGAQVTMGTDAKAGPGVLAVPSVPSIPNPGGGRVGVEVKALTRISIQPEFVDVNEMTLPLRPGRQLIDPQFVEA